MQHGYKIKVLFLPKWYPEKNSSTFGIFVRKHAVAVSRFSDVAVLYVNSGNVFKKDVFEIVKTTENNIFTIRVYYKKVTSGYLFFSSLLKLCRYCVGSYIGYKIIEKEFGKPDLTHLHIMAKPGLSALPLKFFKKIPFVISEHWSGYLPEDGSFSGFQKFFLTKLIVASASAVTTVSNALKNAMMETHRLQNKYFVVPNIIEHVSESKLQSKSDIKIDILVVCDLIDEVKNISGIIRAFEKSTALQSNVYLHVVGDGKDRKKLEYMAAKSNLLNTKIFFHGEIENDKVYEKMLQSDFLILNSNYENFPCVLLEAFACGIPVVATKVGGVPEIVNEERGILIEKNNYQQLCNAIDFMLVNCRNYDKQKLHKFAHDNFTYETVGKKFFDIYTTVLKK